MPADRTVGRSEPFTGRRRALAYLPLLGFLGYVGWSHYKWGYSSDTAFLATFFALMAGVIT